jgi:S-adenosylmethionine:tRNA ribosyltransferase-isomerase
VNRDPDAIPTSAFDYPLPAELIAHYPAAQRDASRMLVLERATGAILHRGFADLRSLMQPGDALVLNETRVFPARLVGHKTTGAAAEVLLLRPAADAARIPLAHGEPSHDGAPVDDSRWHAPTTGTGEPPTGEPMPGLDATTWEALVRPGARLRAGACIDIADDLQIEILDQLPDGGRIVRIIAAHGVSAAIARHGRVPLPPYIDREPDAADRERYQTVYARETGSVAAPTAGLHFTPALLHQLETAGVTIVRVTLHVGPATFRPVDVDDPAAHPMHSEPYHVSEDAALRINATRRAGGRVWAVGTTVVRTLETLADATGHVHAGSGETSLFIRPPWMFRAVDRLITNFHLPRSTLLMLVCAFAGHLTVMHAYDEAIRQRYRFFSYGDCMVIL